MRAVSNDAAEIGARVEPDHEYRIVEVVMADGFIGIDITGLPELQAYLKRLPPAVADAVVDAVSKLAIDIFQSEQPSKKYVTRKAAYGQSFQSDKQRRWFFAALNKGAIQVPYNRTQAMRRAWKQIGAGAKSIVANEAEGVEFVMGDGTQSRHEALVGWKTVSKMIKEHTPRIERVAIAAAQKAIDKA